MSDQEDRPREEASEDAGSGPAPEPASEVIDGDAVGVVDAEALGASDEVLEIVEALVRARDDAKEARTRALADLLNFQRRSEKNEDRAREGGVAAVVRSLLPVFDTLLITMQQDAGSMIAEQAIGAMEMLRGELEKALSTHGVVAIRPEPGAAFDPHEHEAMQRQPSAEHPEDTVTLLVQPGFRRGDVVIRPARVFVSAGVSEDAADAAGG